MVIGIRLSVAHLTEMQNRHMLLYTTWYMTSMKGTWQILGERTMARYSLNLPTQLKYEAEAWATKQGISLNQFILWAVAEKVGALSQHLDDPTFPHITYRRGASGQPMAVLRGTGLRVQTVVVATQTWGFSPAQIAAEYDLSLAQVNEALAFYEAHFHEIDVAIAAEDSLEAEIHG
jgi:uncharacterized protein (DUF433 family)